MLIEVFIFGNFPLSILIDLVLCLIRNRMIDVLMMHLLIMSVDLLLIGNLNIFSSLTTGHVRPHVAYTFHDLGRGHAWILPFQDLSVFLTEVNVGRQRLPLNMFLSFVILRCRQKCRFSCRRSLLRHNSLGMRRHSSGSRYIIQARSVASLSILRFNCLLG